MTDHEILYLLVGFIAGLVVAWLVFGRRWRV